VIFFLGTVALANSFVAPGTRDVWSPSGSARVHVDTSTNIWTVYTAAAPQTPLWAFDHFTGFEGVGVSDDGQSVVITAWEYVRVGDLDEPALEWRSRGETQTVSIRSLVSQPSRTRLGGPMGDFWRVWYDGMRFTPDEIVVTTTGPWSYRFGWDGTPRGRGLAPLGAMVWTVGLLAWGLALAVVGLAAAELRAGTGPVRVGVVLLAALPGASWLGLYLAGAPVPAELLMPLDMPLWATALLATLPALVAARWTQWRRLWLALLLLLAFEVATVPVLFMTAVDILAYTLSELSQR
jgi:hypothetical protein